METDLIQGDDVLMLDGQTGTTAWDKEYLEIARQQVELLVAAGFKREKAVQYYPAAAARR